MRRAHLLSLLFGSLVGITGGGACKSGTTSTRSIGTETNWLRDCTSDDDCGGLHCICEVCTSPCSANGTCSLEGGVCRESDSPAVDHLCASTNSPPATGVCLPRCAEGCESGTTCVDEVCVSDDSVGAGGALDGTGGLFHNAGGTAGRDAGTGRAGEGLGGGSDNVDDGGGQAGTFDGSVGGAATAGSFSGSIGTAGGNSTSLGGGGPDAGSGGLVNAGNGGGTTDGRGGAGGSGGASGSGGEYIDGDGRCRVNEETPLMACPATYAETLQWNPPCGSPCSGLCGGALVAIYYCAPSRGCAYDPDTELHIGTYFGDDVRVHCDNTSYDVIHGDWPFVPEGCELTRRDTSDACPIIP